MNRELYDEAIRSNILSRKLIEQLMESMNYSSISFINWTVEVLKIIRTRLERGDKITDEVSGITYDIKSFRNFVSTNFSITGVHKCSEQEIIKVIIDFFFCLFFFCDKVYLFFLGK